MDLNVVDRILSTFIIPSRSRQIKVVFSGGEPLLLPLSWYREAIGRLSSVGSPRVHFGVQTNGTVLTSEHVEFLHEYNVQLSVSLDGPPHVNDIQRGNGDEVIRNLGLLMGYGLDVGVIALISPSTWDHIGDVYDFFCKLEVRKVRFNTCYPVGRAASMPALTTQQIFVARRTILDRMLASDGEGPLDRNLLEQIRWFVRPSPEGWPLSRKGCGGFFCPAGEFLFSVNPEGDIYPCTDITFTRPEFRLGSVFDTWDDGAPTTMIAVLDKFHSKGLWWRRCQDCDAAVICDYGCPAFVSATPRRANLECNATRHLWLYLNERRDDVQRFAERLGILTSSGSPTA